MNERMGKRSMVDVPCDDQDNTIDRGLHFLIYYFSLVYVVLQMIGLYCNQACGRVVESSPRQEMMTAERQQPSVKLLAATPSITTLDITGGAQAQR
jgi:hypothetical protein